MKVILSVSQEDDLLSIQNNSDRHLFSPAGEAAVNEHNSRLIRVTENLEDVGSDLEVQKVANYAQQM